MHGQTNPLESIRADETQIKYIGKSWGLVNILGPVSGGVYRISLGHPYLAAKTIDVSSGQASKPGLVQLTRSGSRIFELYRSPDEPQPEPTLDPEGDPVVDDQPDEPEADVSAGDPVVEAQASADSSAPLDSATDPQKIGLLTISEIKNIPVDSYEWTVALDAEKSDKNRTGVVSYIEGLLS